MFTKRFLITCLTALLALSWAQAQNSVGIGTNTPNPKSVLELVSPGQNQGFLLPRLTTTEINAIAPIVSDRGLMVYDNTTNEIKYWDGSVWQSIGIGGISTLGGLTDVTLTAPVNGNFLRYNGTSWVNTSSIFPVIAAIPTPGTQFQLNHTGTGNTFRVTNSSPLSTDYVMSVEAFGNAIAGYFVNNNPAATNQALYTHTLGSGPALVSFGLGPNSQAGRFANTDLGSTQPTVVIENAGTGLGLQVTSGGVRVNQLGGGGTRMVVANNTGILGTAALPTGTVSSIGTGTGLTGGPITTTGTISLENTTVTPAAYGGAATVGTFTVDATGRLTAANNQSIAINTSQVTTGVFGINRGGTNGTATPTAGAVAYGTGTAYAFTGVGSAGQILQSNGAAAPNWVNPPTFSGWGLTGNAGTNPSTNYIGTNDAQALSIRTAGVERMNISSSGDIGVNTTAAALYKFQAFRQATSVSADFGPGRASVYGYRGGENAPAQGGTNWTANGVDAAVKGFSFWGNNFTAGVAGHNFNDYANSAGVIGSNENAAYWGALGFRDSANATWGVYTEQNAHVGGNLGIGTRAPAAKLHAFGTGNVTSILESSSTVGTWDVISNTSTGGRIFSIISTGSANGGGPGRLLFSSNVAYGITTANIMILDHASANVGIGSINPSARLDVRGPGNFNLASTEGDFRIGNDAFRLKIGVAYGGGGAGDVYIGAQGGTNRMFLGAASASPTIADFQTMAITSTGVGIENGSPNAPLQFSNALANRKIVLFEAANNDHQYYGFGINNNILRYQVNQIADNHVFFAGTSTTTSNELMRITGGGNVGIGTAAPTQRLHVVNNILPLLVSNTANSTVADGIRVQSGSNTAAGSWMVDFRRPDFTQIGRIEQVSASNIAYNTTSDSRLKNLIGESSKGLKDLLEIKIYDYIYKDDASGKVMTGFVAQELFNVFPQSVTQPREGEPNNPSQNPWMVDYGSITPLLIKAIQDQQKIIESLQKRIESLESK